jgi:hypothetical protein
VTITIDNLGEICYGVERGYVMSNARTSINNTQTASSDYSKKKKQSHLEDMIDIIQTGRATIISGVPKHGTSKHLNKDKSMK